MVMGAGYRMTDKAGRDPRAGLAQKVGLNLSGGYCGERAFPLPLPAAVISVMHFLVTANQVLTSAALDGVERQLDSAREVPFAPVNVLGERRASMESGRRRWTTRTP
jgi:hypothetical protein